MNAVAKKCYMAELHLFEERGTYFVFIPYNLRLFEVDRDTYHDLTEMYAKYGTETPIISDDEQYIESGILYEAEESMGDPIKTRCEADELAVEGGKRIGSHLRRCFADCK